MDWEGLQVVLDTCLQLQSPLPSPCLLLWDICSCYSTGTTWISQPLVRAGNSEHTKPAASPPTPPASSLCFTQTSAQISCPGCPEAHPCGSCLDTEALALKCSEGHLTAQQLPGEDWFLHPCCSACPGCVQSEALAAPSPFCSLIRRGEGSRESV